MMTEEVSTNNPPKEEEQEASAAIIDGSDGKDDGGDGEEEEFTPVETLEPLADTILVEEDDDELAYNSHASDEEENDPYTDISSMSEEGGENLMDSSLVLNLQSSGEKDSNDNSNNNNNSSSGLSDPKTHLLQLQFSRSNSTSSSKHDRNNSTNSATLECVADPQIPPHSPLGSAASIASNGSPHKQLPRFYDSEEEGAGSLVFVGDNASYTRMQSSSPKTASPMGGMFLRSSNSSEDGGSVVRVPPKEPRRSPSGNGEAPALLPYNMRKKLNAPPPPALGPGSPVHAPGDGKRNHQDRPPMIPPPPQLQPPPAQAPSASKSKYKVAAIPVYKGRKGRGQDRDPSAASDTGSDTGGEGGGGGRSRMRKVKSSPGRTAPKGGRGKRGSGDREAGGNKNSPEKVLSPQSGSERDRDKSRPPRAPSSSHDVIDPGYSSKDPPPSPRSGGYHIRINSQGSVSSLGSDGAGAGDSDVGNLNHLGMGSPHGPPRLPPHPKSNPNHYQYDQYGMQQQQPQYQQQHQQHHAPPPPPPPEPGGGPPLPPNVNYNDVLAQEVAHFLQGEQIARQAEAQAPPPYPHGPPPHWGPGHGPPHGYAPHGYGPPNPYHPHYQGGPGGYQIEPRPPPMMQYHPNMQWGHRREPCHSISEDDWEETLQELNAKEGEQGDAVAEADYNQGRSRKQPGRGQQQQRPHQSNWDQQREQQFQRGPPRGGYDQRLHYEQQDQRMNHYSQLPPSQGGNQYDNRRYPSGQQSSSDGRRGRHRSTPSGGRDDFASETSGLLPSAGIRTYESRDGRPDMYQMGMDPAWGGGRPPPQQQQQLYHYHGHQGPSMTPQSDSKKKRSKRRRREKEKRQRLYSDDTDEDNPDRRGRHHHHAHHGSKSKKKGRRHRKRRSGGLQGNPQDESLTGESYGESTRLSSGRSDRSGSVIKVERQGNFLTQRLTFLKLLVCNLPLSFAAISFSVVLLGVVWLEWAKEALPSCKEVTFHSSQCDYAEFPGCYFCDEYDRRYAFAAQFRRVCGYLAGASVMLFFAKATLCWRAFIDEMSSPTTASPSGLIFMTMALSFVGDGDVGALLVVVASFLHLVLVVWFIYMSMAYGSMTDPSWFANTIGIGLCAVKIWSYYPLSGHFLIIITLMMTFLFYPICLIRVALNEKMSATICWINMMGPAISLYALAIIMQPNFQQERPDISNFQTVQRSVYLPTMTFLFVLCVVGMLSSIHGLIVRWKQIASEEFSPAHAAYSFPLLMHALAVQSYRSSLDFFADADAVSPSLATALRLYWMALLIAGTLVASICIVTYLVLLPSWVDVDTRDEAEPPEPNDTSISLSQSLTYGESLIQPYVSPTILQANETGIVVMTYDRQNDWCDLVRTLRVPAFGFEPMMSRRAFRRERAALRLFMGGQDVILEGNESRAGDEDDDDVISNNELERATEAV